MGIVDLTLTNPAAGLLSSWHAARPFVPLLVSAPHVDIKSGFDLTSPLPHFLTAKPRLTAPQVAAPTAHTLVPQSNPDPIKHADLTSDPTSIVFFGALATATLAESFKYLILQKGKPKAQKPAATDRPKIEIPTEFLLHVAKLEALFGKLTEHRTDPQKRFELVTQIVHEVMEQMPKQQAALTAATTPEQRLAVLKAISHDYEAIYRLNQTVWQARHTEGFLADFAAFRKFYFETEDNAMKSVPQMAHSLHNVVQTFFWSTIVLAGLDASFATMHNAMPSLFYDFTPTYDYLSLEPLKKKLIEFAGVGLIYNWLVYYGRDGFYTMNTKGSAAKISNAVVDAAGSILDLGGLVSSAVRYADVKARDVFGPGYETFANGVRVWYTEALAGFSKFVKYESPKHGEDIATVLEWVFGSLSTLIQFIIFRGNPDLAFTEKFAKAFANLPELLAKQLAPAALFNWIRARAQTKIQQNPRNDNVSAQIYRMANGVFSGALFNAMNKHLADIALPLFVVNQIILGRLTHVFADTVNNEDVRDRTSLTWEKLKKSLRP